MVTFLVSLFHVCSLFRMQNHHDRLWILATSLKKDVKCDALDQSEGISPWQSQWSHLNSFNTSMLQCRKVTQVNKVSVDVNSTRFFWMQRYDCKINHSSK